MLKYKRVLLKLSGEALKENSDMILSADALESMAKMVKKIHDAGVQICIVIGAGNIWRGKIAKDAGSAAQTMALFILGIMWLVALWDYFD